MLQRKNKEEEDSYKVKKRTADLLPDASNNIAKLEVGVMHKSIFSDFHSLIRSLKTDVVNIFINLDLYFKFNIYAQYCVTYNHCTLFKVGDKKRI